MCNVYKKNRRLFANKTEKQNRARFLNEKKLILLIEYQPINRQAHQDTIPKIGNCKSQIEREIQ